MAKKRIKKSRKKSYLKRASRRKSRHTYRRKDKRKIKKTRKKRLRGGAHLPEGRGQVETLEEEPSIMRHQQPEPEPVAGLSSLSSSKTVNVDDELLMDTNIGIISGHGVLFVGEGEEFFVIPEGICLWVPISAGVGLSATRYDKFRKYGPGALIQNQIISTAATWGTDGQNESKTLIHTYMPSFLLTGRNKEHLNVSQMGLRSGVGTYRGGYGNVIQLTNDNRGEIEETIFKEHDERIMPKSELMSVDDDVLVIEKIKLPVLFKKISEAQKKYADSPNPIPRNWVGHFCRSGKALNLDYLKTLFLGYGIKLEDDIFGGVINYKQGDGSQLTHQSSLSSRRFPSNFKQIVNELYELNRGGENETDLYEIKNKIDGMQPLGFLDVAKVLINLLNLK